MIIRSVEVVGWGMIAAVGSTIGDRLDETTSIKLGSALAVACVVIPAVWWIGSWMRGLNDRLDSIRATLKLHEKILESLPCGEVKNLLKNTACEPTNKKGTLLA